MIIQSIFQKIEPVLIRMYYRCRYPSTPNLRGDRDIEWSWVTANLPDGPGVALDLGCGSSPLGLIATRRGDKTTAIDLAPVRWFYAHPDLNFIQKDIFDLKARPQTFDLIINCSSIEHVGLAGRYAVQKCTPTVTLKPWLR